MITCRCGANNDEEQLEKRAGRCRNCARWIKWTRTQLREREQRMEAKKKKAAPKKRVRRAPRTLEAQAEAAGRKVEAWKARVKNAVFMMNKWERAAVRLNKRVEAQLRDRLNEAQLQARMGAAVVGARKYTANVISTSKGD